MARCSTTRRLFTAAMICVVVCLLPTTKSAFGVICIAPDDGTGTAVMPPTCSQGYLSPDQVHMIINGLPPGTHITVDSSHSRFGLTSSGPGGSLGGEFEQFNSDLQMNMQGTGSLATFMRFKMLQLQCETHIGPRTRGNPVQSFDTVMFMMQGQLPPGDPDFDLLRITAGNGFGMPSPGHTTLVLQADGNWAVDSFFDIEYRIDFIGHSPGPLGGMSGSTRGTIRMRAGEPSCRCAGDYTGDLLRALDDVNPFVLGLLSDSYDPCADLDGNLTDDGADIDDMVRAIVNSTPCPALDAWETPPSGAPSTTPSSYAFGGAGDQPPIPAGFFGPGSDPFVGTVLLDGHPIELSTLGPTDTIVRRPPLVGAPVETVPIELVELNLSSANPITVTYGGIATEQWIVNTAISDTPAPGGLMNVMESFPGGGTFDATIPVRPVFVFTRQQDLADLQGGLITPDQVEVRVIDTGDPGSPTNPLQINFAGQQSDWVRQVCGPQVLGDGLFFFHNLGAGFIPGVKGIPPDPCEQFKPGPMRHVKPGESHYIKPPNKNPGGVVPPRCGYNLLGQRAFCRAGKVGACPPAPAVLCTRICGPGTPPCPPFAIRLVRIRCLGPLGFNRGWCFQFYMLRPPPLDCAVCP